MNSKEIRKAIRETKQEMKELGIRRISFMNRVDTTTHDYNFRLFKLGLDLEKAKATEGKKP